MECPGTRALQVIYSFGPTSIPVFVGQAHGCMNEAARLLKQDAAGRALEAQKSGRADVAAQENTR